jgi:hypothetical protein
VPTYFTLETNGTNELAKVTNDLTGQTGVSREPGNNAHCSHDCFRFKQRFLRGRCLARQFIATAPLPHHGQCGRGYGIILAIVGEG